MKGNMVLLEFLIFPGLLFTAIAGLLTSWVDRKVTALVQMRVGPPLLQPFYDIRKLFIKETCVPEGGAIGLFLLAPLLGLAAVTLASMILWRTLLDVEATFVGDLIVLIYLLVMPALSVMLGSFASRNPLASPVFGDYRGIPPLLIQVGEHEMLRDDSIRVADKARTDGIPVKLEVWKGMFHVFQSHEPLLPEAQAAIEHMAEFIHSMLPKP